MNMKVSWKISLTASLVVGLWVVGFATAVRTAAQEQPRMKAPIAGKKAGEYFKNVTTSTLKELPVDDFIGAMGVMSAALGLDCADCHPGAGSDKVDWVFDTGIKKTARRMVEMVGVLNKANFGGAQKVTCWTCHHGRMIPATSIMLNMLYDTPNSELDDRVVIDREQPPALEVLDKYIAAMGGAQKLDAIKNFVATGASIGFGGFGVDGQFQIFANRGAGALVQRTTVIKFPDHLDRGESLWSFNGTTGWINTQRALLENYELVGGELDGQRLEAQLAFPGNIKNYLNNWRLGFRRVIGDKAYLVLQGDGPRNFMATFYIDPDTYLLARVVRYVPSPAGHVLVQIDYSDYREVNGVKFPFQYDFYWLDGKYSAKIKDVKVNTTIDPAIFGKPKDQ